MRERAARRGPTPGVTRRCGGVAAHAAGVAGSDAPPLLVHARSWWRRRSASIERWRGGREAADRDVQGVERDWWRAARRSRAEVMERSGSRETADAYTRRLRSGARAARRAIAALHAHRRRRRRGPRGRADVADGRRRHLPPHVRARSCRTCARLSRARLAVVEAMRRCRTSSAAERRGGAGAWSPDAAESALRADEHPTECECEVGLRRASATAPRRRSTSTRTGCRRAARRTDLVRRRRRRKCSFPPCLASSALVRGARGARPAPRRRRRRGRCVRAAVGSALRATRRRVGRGQRRRTAAVAAAAPSTRDLRPTATWSPTPPARRALRWRARGSSAVEWARDTARPPLRQPKIGRRHGAPPFVAATHAEASSAGVAKLAARGLRRRGATRPQQAHRGRSTRGRRGGSAQAGRLRRARAHRHRGDGCRRSRLSMCFEGVGVRKALQLRRAHAAGLLRVRRLRGAREDASDRNIRRARAFLQADARRAVGGAASAGGRTAPAAAAPTARFDARQADVHAETRPFVRCSSLEGTSSSTSSAARPRATTILGSRLDDSIGDRVRQDGAPARDRRRCLVGRRSSGSRARATPSARCRCRSRRRATTRCAPRATSRTQASSRRCASCSNASCPLTRRRRPSVSTSAKPVDAARTCVHASRRARRRRRRR